MPIVQHKRGTRANLETLKTNSQLVVGQLYVITDESRIAIGTAINAYVDYAKKSETDAKASTSVATTSANGLMSSTDKTKLDGVATNANNYVHPANHAPSIITQDASNRFVTDTEKSTWNAKQAALVSGTDIKTINSTSLLGAGNINLNDTYYTETEVNSLLSNRVATNTAITGATKTKITYDAKGLVTSGADATTADIADSLNKRYVTDAYLTILGNTSGTNTGDESQSTIKTKLGAATTSVDGYLTSTDWNTFNNKQAAITGGATTITSSNLTASRALISDASGKVAVSSTVTDTELGYLDGVTSSIQTQINGKQASLGFTAENSANKENATINTSTTKYPTVNLLKTGLDGKVTTNTAITGATKTKITYDAKGLVTAGTDLANTDMPTAIDATKIANGNVSNTEFQYLDGVTSAIQTQLNARMDALNVTTGTSLTIDFATYNFHRITISGNASFSLSNVPTNKVVTVGILNTGGGVVTLPNTADYRKADTYTHTANGYIEYSIFYDGTNRFWQVSEEIKA